MLDFSIIASCVIILITIILYCYLQKSPRNSSRKSARVSKPSSKEELLKARVKHFEGLKTDDNRKTEQRTNHDHALSSKNANQEIIPGNQISESNNDDDSNDDDSNSFYPDTITLTSSLSYHLDGNVLPECKPIKTLSELLNWIPGWDDISIAGILRRPISRDNARPKTLICHDMKGGYIEDRFVQGYNSDKCFTFNHWNLIDSFCYFSHSFITIPPPCWTNAAHNHGVKMLGTFITEWNDGAAICAEIFQSISEVEKVAQKLVDIANYYQFDGWLINIENPIDPGCIENVRHFLLTLTNLMHENIPESEVIWYDSVTRNGELKWQNKLCIENVMFFDVCDGIFLNYNWSIGDLQHSLVMSKPNRQFDVYVGVDVFGRGCFGGGGWNTCKAMNVIREQNLSAAIFAPGWVMETLDVDNFPENDEKFWKLLRTYLYGHSISTLPFVSTFCKGYGKKVFVCGQEVSSNSWTNLSSASIQPLCYNNFYQLGPYDGMEIYLKSSGFTTDFGFNGGGCYTINGVVKPQIEQTKTVFRLFDTKIPLKASKEYFLSHSFHCSTDKIKVFAILLFEDRPNYLLFMPCKDQDSVKYSIPITQEGNYVEIYPWDECVSCYANISASQGWNTLNYKFHLEKAGLLKEIRIACTTGGVQKESETTEFTVRVGEIRIHRLSELYPYLPTAINLKCQNVNIRSDGEKKRLSFTLSWEVRIGFALPKCYDIFCRGHCNQEVTYNATNGYIQTSENNGYGFFLGRAYTNSYHVSDLIVPAMCTRGIDLIVQSISYAEVRQEHKKMGIVTLKW